MSTITLNDIETTLGGRGARRRLADRVGVTPQAVGSWFRHGQIPPQRVEAVADATGYSVDAVLRARGYTDARGA